MPSVSLPAVGIMSAADVTAAGAGVTAAVGAAATTGVTIGEIASVGSMVAAVGSGVMGAVQSREQGIAQADDAKMRSRQAGLEAGQKAIQNRQNMLRALASQNAAAGVSGIGTGGPTSFGANVNRQINQQQNDLLALSADTSATQQQYAYQAQNATAGGNLKAGTSLLDMASNSNFQNTVGAGLTALGNI